MDSHKKGMAEEIAKKLGGKKPAGPSPEVDEEEEYEGDAQTAMRELFAAMKDDDVEAGIEAFKALKASC